MKRSLLLAALLVGAAPEQEKPAQLWIYCSFNLLVDKNVDRLEGILRRAAKAGYTRVMLADSKFGRLPEMDERYFKNCARVKKLCEELKLTLVPCVFPVGYSNSILSQDPNLAEGMPVRDALFVVKDGVARLEADPPVELRGGDFEDLAKWDWHDKTVTADNGAAKVQGVGNARIVQKVKVAPFRCYHISVRAKTEKFEAAGEARLQVLVGGHALHFSNLGVKPTQDWTTHHVIFNSLENTEVLVYVGVWGARGGTLWWDDAKIEEIGLLNVLRRDGCPFEVKGYVEGKDFERVVDPKMGIVPYAGEYEVWHEPPSIKCPSLPDGTKLRVSWYHPATIHDGQVTMCVSEPKTMDLLRDQADRIEKIFGVKHVMMSHDEIRCLNWDASCERRKMDAGAILADHVRECEKILRKKGSTVYVWSDMFDPNHDAHKDYYLVRGDLAGSWEGLSKEVIIVTWYFGKRDPSLKFFTDRGHRVLMAGYYDGDVASNVKGWLDSAKKVKGVVGIMYTTWENKYDDLEKFAEAVQKHH